MLIQNSHLDKPIYSVDLNFQGIPGAIASYVIPHKHGVILIETGPGSTIPELSKSLDELGFSPSDITHVLLTHIHLDHAGAAGYLANQGAHIYVHKVGAPHLINPEKLLSSATRIYRDMMDELWGDFLPVPEDCLSILEDGDILEIEDLQFEVLDTPGHATHHHAYIHKDICFTGDVGGVRLQNTQFIRLPMPPPEFVVEDWRKSLGRLKKEFDLGKYHMIAPTHFGIFDDPGWHLQRLDLILDETENWIVNVMTKDPTIEELKEEFLDWIAVSAKDAGMQSEILDAYEAANPSWMSVSGIYRYWHKVRNINQND
jgi:glyoxylase-like metal-dependent hydrolase (beta-lactamase superfamily II)